MSATIANIWYNYVTGFYYGNMIPNDDAELGFTPDCENVATLPAPIADCISMENLGYPASTEAFQNYIYAQTGIPNPSVNKEGI